MKRRAIRPFGVLAVVVVVAACAPSPVPSPVGLDTSTAVAPTSSPATSATVAQSSGSTPTPSPSQAARTPAWHRAALPHAEDIFGFDAALGGFVASGWDSDSNGARWWSADGSTWRRLRGVAGIDTIVRNDGTRRGGIGLGCTVDHPGAELCAAFGIWRSVDGTRWRSATRIVGLRNVTVRDVLLRDVAANSGRLVAIGVACPGPAATSPCRKREVMLTSTDGLTWRLVTRIPTPKGLIWRDVNRAGGGFIATGWVPSDSSGHGPAFVWTSPDGRVWGRGVELPGIVGGSPVLAAGDGQGFVVAGNTENNTWTVFTSTDGRQWSEAPDQAAFAGARIEWIADTGNGVVAVGTSGAAEAASVWTSADGRSWAVTADPPWTGSGMGGAATDGQRVVILRASDDGLGVDSWTTLLPP